MHKLLLCCLLSFPLSALAQATIARAQPTEWGMIEALDSANGFRQFHLGVRIADLPGLKARGKNRHAALTESLRFGRARLDGLFFLAKEGRLSTISFGALGTENGDNLLTEFMIHYGRGQYADYNKLVWVGQVATMVYERKPMTPAPAAGFVSPRATQYCEVTIFSNAIATNRRIKKPRSLNKSAVQAGASPLIF